jgi:hypothetical protein
MFKRITLLIVALTMLSAVASVPLNAAVDFRVYVAPHHYWYGHPYYSTPYYGYPYVYYYRAPAYPSYGFTYHHWGHYRHHGWEHHYYRRW